MRKLIPTILLIAGCLSSSLVVADTIILREEGKPLVGADVIIVGQDREVTAYVGSTPTLKSSPEGAVNLGTTTIKYPIAFKVTRTVDGVTTTRFGCVQRPGETLDFKALSEVQIACPPTSSASKAY